MFSKVCKVLISGSTIGFGIIGSMSFLGHQKMMEKERQELYYEFEGLLDEFIEKNKDKLDLNEVPYPELIFKCLNSDLNLDQEKDLEKIRSEGRYYLNHINRFCFHPIFYRMGWLLKYYGNKNLLVAEITLPLDANNYPGDHPKIVDWMTTYITLHKCNDVNSIHAFKLIEEHPDIYCNDYTEIFAKSALKVDWGSLYESFGNHLDEEVWVRPINKFNHFKSSMERIIDNQ